MMNQNAYNPNMQNMMNQNAYNPNMQNMMNQNAYNPNMQNMMNQNAYNPNMQNMMNQNAYNPNMQNMMNQNAYNPNMQNMMNQNTNSQNMLNMNQNAYSQNMLNMNQNAYSQNMLNMNYYQPLYNQNMNQNFIPRSRSQNVNNNFKFRNNLNNMNCYTNNMSNYNYSNNINRNNIYNQNFYKIGNNTNNINDLNAKTTISKTNKKEYKKRDSKTNNIVQIHKYQENNNDNNDKEKNKYEKRGIESQRNKEKNNNKNESLNNNNQNNKKDNYNGKKQELEGIKEEKQSEEEDLKLNYLIKARGLQNVGATCYMNATLQCLYHVKQLSEALVNDNKIDEKLELTYSFKKLIEELAFINIKKFKIDRRDNHVTGENKNFIKPENFKEVLSKKNPLFKGIKANDSKDLIMYLLEQMDKELTLRNNNSEKMEMFVGTDESELEKEKFKEFHNSIFCDLFYGFQRSDMICYSCKNTNSTYNVFNNLILPIEKTYNSLNNENKNKHKNTNNNFVNIFNPRTDQPFSRRTGYNLNYNFGNNFSNFNNTPDLPKKLNVHDCLKELFKDEILSGDNQIFCNKCRKMSDSINRTTIYKAPNILILILNRGRGNSFECEIKYSSNEILDLSVYNIISQDSPRKYKLFGVISHIGESSDEGHFIAYCKHFDDNWYMFNDSIAKTVGENELTNGVPYILFYRNINLD